MTQSKDIDLTHTQVGVIGDHNIIYGGIHYHIEPPANPRERRNRQAMLQLVHNTWIKGLLEPSLHGAAMLELGMEYLPDAVDHPWDMVIQMPDCPDKAVPPGTRIVDVFNELGGSLLILGEPGSGKTTMLLELARDLIARAEQDETLHIPVVFNLSSWAVKQLPLEEWLVKELCTKYYIPKKIAQTWIQEDTLLLLLDGLDEVKDDARKKCIAAINNFGQQHFVPLAVCSRTAVYGVLRTKLHLRGAIYLCSLTPAQIDTYLADAGTELQAVHATLKHDPVLQEMTNFPLFLSIMTLAYRGLTEADLQTLSAPEARRQHLLDTYIKKMFQRRTKAASYTQEQTLHWLAWLARKMTEHNQTVFYIENLQPDWLPKFERLNLQHSVAGFGRLVTHPNDIAFEVSQHLFDEIHLAETLTWSLREAYNHLVIALKSWWLYCGQVGLAVIVILLSTKFFFEVRVVVGIYLFVLVYMIMTSITVGGLVTSARTDSKIFPNQGIRRSFHNALVYALSYGLVGGLIGYVIYIITPWLGLLERWQDISYFLPIFSLYHGLIYGNGGRAVIFHYKLRKILAHTNRLPRRLIPFLNYCTDRILLRRVGGGYIFIHRLLQEHFAALAPEDIDYDAPGRFGRALLNRACQANAIPQAASTPLSGTVEGDVV